MAATESFNQVKRIKKAKKMKQLSFIPLIFLFCSISVSAQDLLITNNRDTLNCKMEKMKNDSYLVTFVMDDEEISGFIHKDSIFFFKKDFFRGMNDNRLRPWYSLVELGFDAGVAYQYGKFRIDDDLTDKSNFGAKTGLYLGTDLTYYISKRIGYGLKYNYRSLLNGDVCYQYVGPLMVFRFPERKKPNHFFFNFSGGLGWMVQSNAPVQHVLLRPRIKMYAKAFTGDIAVGYSFKLSKRVSVRTKVSCNIGYPGFVYIENLENLTTPSEKPLELGYYCHNMNTVQFTAGFSFHK